MEAVTSLLSTESSKLPKTVSSLLEISSFFLSDFSTKWNPLDLDMMKKRHEQLESHLYTSGKMNSRQPDELIAQPAQDVPISGWCILVENRGWKPCPIGLYNEN